MLSDKDFFCATNFPSVALAVTQHIFPLNTGHSYNLLFPALHETSIKMIFQTQQNKFLAVGSLNLPLLSEAVECL